VGERKKGTQTTVGGRGIWCERRKHVKKRTGEKGTEGGNVERRRFCNQLGEKGKDWKSRRPSPSEKKFFERNEY